MSSYPGYCPSHKTNDRNGDTNDPNGADQIYLCGIPSLFLAARLARRTAPNTMLIRLVAGSDAMGPAQLNPGKKRNRIVE
jgi:hypothetical protein